MEILLIVVVLIAVVAYFAFFKGRGEQPEARQPLPGEPSEAKSEAKAPSDREKAPEASAPKPAKPVAKDESEPEPGEERGKVRGEAEEPAPEPAAEREPPPPPSKGPDVATLRKGLARSRDSSGVFGRLKALFSTERDIDASIAEEIEEILLSSDVGATTTSSILERIRERLGKGELGSSDAVWAALRAEALRMLGSGERSTGLEVKGRPTVVLFVGVNGAGKTTTIGKLATQLHESGKRCVLAAGDTFRAAAVQQLIIWGDRVGCEVVHGKDGADPGSVLFDAIKKAEDSGADFVLADTAGRLHTKTNLMNEMQKIARTAGKALNGAPHETFLVIDSTNGQNALAQAREFKEALEISGIVLTKLDGTAKGGVVLGISDSLSLPVRYVGLGEGPKDLHEFVPQRFVDALLGDERAA